MSDVPTKDNLTKLFSATGIVYVKGPDLLTDARAIIDAAQASAYRAVNVALVYRNWLLGRRIAEEDLGGKDRAEYGKQVVVNMSKQLTMLYGSSFDFTNLYKFMQFYRTFPILDSLCLKSGGLLDWSHYRTLLQVGNEDARRWYMEESGSQSWGVRTLQRNISSQYYERTLLSQNKEAVKNEMVRVTAPLQDKLEFIKNPVVAEFLGLSQRTDFTESDLETCILDNLGENSAKHFGCADAGHVFDAERRKVAQTFRPCFHSPCRFDILFPAMLRQSFTEFIFATNTDGSGKAASYVHALDMLGLILTKYYPKPIVGGLCGAFKVGDTSFKSSMKASELTVNCAELKGAAKSASTSRQVRRASSKFSIMPNAHLDWGIRAASACRFSRQKPCLQSATQCQSAIRRECRFDVPRSREDCPSSRALKNVIIINTIIGSMYG